ncbi:MAG: DMT family transporter [Clostridia bacterium]|nr:DMT family transporter [Clostridia bacterium]
MSELEQRKLNPGPIYLVAAAILWSMAGVLTKFIPWSATSVACLRGLIAAMVQMAYSRTWKIKLTKPILLTAVCYLGETLLFTFANKMTSAGSAIVLQNTSPLYIMLMGLIVLKQKPSKLDCCVGAVIFSGILLSMLDTFRGGELPGSNPMLGNLLALASGVFYAGIFFTSRLPGADSLQSAILGNLMYVFFIPLLFTDQAMMNPATTGVPAWQSWLAIFFMGTCQLGLSWICFSRGIKTTPSLQASFITMIEPVLNPILALLLLGEAMGTLSVIGSALVIVTIVVHNVLTAKKADQAAANS